MIAAAIAFALKNWKLIGIGLVVALLAIQSARLGHAKSDQFDRSACVKGQPCKPVKWKAEVVTLRSNLQKMQSALDICHSNVTTLQGSVDAQNGAVAALKADSDRRSAEVAQARQATRREAERADHAASLLANAKPVGNDLCARMLDADRKVRAATE
jgi:hypothetical protein